MKIGLVDTTFSRINMGKIAIDEINKINNQKIYPQVEYIRRTVPGIKDIAIECQILFENEKCDIVLALGMVGGNEIDKMCAHEASLAIQQVKLKYSKHNLEIFAHVTESLKNGKLDEKDFYSLTENRIRKHVQNAFLLLFDRQKLIDRAGKGIRQGRGDEGEIKCGK